MKTLYLILLSLFSSISLFSQTSIRESVVDNQFGWLKEVAPKPVAAKGSVYLNETWTQAEVYLNSGTKITDVPVKYDLKNDILEIDTKEGIKVVPKHLLKKFEIKSSAEPISYLNSQQLKIKSLAGIFREMVSGHYSLYIKPELEVIQANYNAAMDVGEKADQYIKKERVYLLTDQEAIDVTKANKKILTYFGDKADEVEAFVKEKKLSFKEKSDLVLIIQEFNRLAKG
jgi:hypothetical protein